MSRNVSRRSILAGAGAAAALGTATTTIMAAPADDSRLLDLCRRWRELEPVIDRLSKQHTELWSKLPSTEWTPEELKAHRIDGDKDKPRRLTLADIEKNDGWDHPGRSTTEWSTEDGEDVRVMTITTRYRTATDDEVSAWRDRCTARRALHDAKWTAHNDVKAASGFDAVDELLEAKHEERDRLADEIKAYRPVTLAGVLEKMRVLREADADNFDGEPDELNWTATLFLAALADLERIAGTT